MDILFTWQVGSKGAWVLACSHPIIYYVVFEIPSIFLVAQNAG